MRFIAMFAYHTVDRFRYDTLRIVLPVLVEFKIKNVRQRLDNFFTRLVDPQCINIEIIGHKHTNR